MFGYEGFLLDKDVFIQELNTEVAIADAQRLPASGGFIDVSQFERFAFLIGAGSLDTQTVFKVEQDTSATATAGIKDVTGATITVSATGDNKWYLIEVDAALIDNENDFHYVTLKATGPAGGNDYASVWFFGFGAQKPVTQPTGTGGRGGAVAVS
jgi:hypothetical protein